MNLKTSILICLTVLVGFSFTFAQVALELQTNSTTSTPHLKLVEEGTDFARLRLENTDNPGKYWSMDASTNSIGTSALNFVYNDGSSSGNIMTWRGDEKTIGIGVTGAEYALDIRSSLASPGSGTGPWGGLNINGGTDNNWTLFSFSNLFDFYYKNVLKGRISGIDGSYTPMSDFRLKDNIEVIDMPQLGNIRKLRPVTYHMKDDTRRSSRASGFIAQDVRDIYPSLVVEGTEVDSYLSLNYTAMIPYLVKGIQELAKQNDLLAQQVAELYERKQTSAQPKSKLGKRK